MRGPISPIPKAEFGLNECNRDITTVVPALPFVNNGHTPSVSNRAGLF